MNMALGPTGIKRIKQFVHIGHNGMLLKTLWRQLEILPRDVLLLGAQYPQRYEMLVFFGKFLHEIKIGPPKQFGCHFFHNCRCQKTCDAAMWIRQFSLYSRGCFLNKISQIQSPPSPRAWIISMDVVDSAFPRKVLELAGFLGAAPKNHGAPKVIHCISKGDRSAFPC